MLDQSSKYSWTSVFKKEIFTNSTFGQMIKQCREISQSRRILFHRGNIFLYPNKQHPNKNPQERTYTF